MAFNFNSLATTKPANNNSYLKPYNIYDNITIKSTEIKEGTTGDGRPWKSLNITFGNDEGILTHSIFYFDEKDKSNWERRTFDMSNGGKRELPSTAEDLQNTIAAIGFAFFPEDFKKLQEVVVKIQTTEQLMAYFKKFVDKNIGKNPTKMKVVGRSNNGRVYASLPKFTGIAQANDQKRAADNNVEVGEWYTWMSSPFGDNLYFTNYEKKQADSYNNAAPTPMESDSTLDIDNNTLGTDDFDLENLL